MIRFNAIYESMCPNCGGPIVVSRLLEGLPCENCLPRTPSRVDVESVARVLKAGGKLGGFEWLRVMAGSFRDFSSYFKAKVGFEMWSAQASWARRLLSLDSFAITAPTGVGKSTLLSVYSAYKAEVHGWRILYLVPTENLARQTVSRLSTMTGGVIAYYSTMPSKAKAETLKLISSGSFKVLVITTGFLERRFEMLSSLKPFNLIVVDDVDSLLRNSRNVERILGLLGFTEETIMLAWNLVKAKLKLYKALQAGATDRIARLEESVGELELKLREKLKGESRGQLIVASATGRPRGVKHLLFKELLDFEVGGSGDYVRNVIDAYRISGDPSAYVSIVKELGPGGIVFVSQHLGAKLVDVVARNLEATGLRVGKALSGSWRSVEKLERGELDVIVSVASRYGVAVRGLDAPRAVKYAVFVGVPARKMRVEEALLNPQRLLRVAMHMRDEGVEGSEDMVKVLREVVEGFEDPGVIVAALRRGFVEGPLEYSVRAYRGVYEKALDWVKEKLGSSHSYTIGSMVFTREEGGDYMYSPDVLTYIQASGRTSRLLDGRLTLGLSVIVEPMEHLVKAFALKLNWLAKASLANYEDLDIGRVKGELEKSRAGYGREFKVKSVLVIVESPTKARTIAWFWGRPGKRRVKNLIVYETSAVDVESGTVYLLQVTASRGHIFDLVENVQGSIYGVLRDGDRYSPVYGTVKRCLSCGAQFIDSLSCPKCGSSNFRDSKVILEVLRKLAMEVDEVIISTDPDREGEKIAWDIFLALKTFNGNVRRARFHEVTREAFLKALREASEFNVKAVEAQIARRIVDRWVGYSLSEVLQSVYNARWMGAGRVQSPVLGWIVDRYSERLKSMGYSACLNLSVSYKVCIYTGSREEAERLMRVDSVKVKSLELSEETLSPPPPFTTDSLIYEASRRLRLTAEATMRVAQELFESGLITYHRTDSTRVSPAGIAVAREYLDRKNLGDAYKPRGWGEGGAHEAIRPTRPLDLEDLDRALSEGLLKVHVKLLWPHRALYDLIFRRFTASQMVEARVVKAKVNIGVLDRVETLNVVAGVIYEGFTRIYSNFKVEGWLLKVKEGDDIGVESSTVRKSSPISLYTSGDLVKLMKEKGVGRPSTYHKAIEANKRHGYIVESKRHRLLIPTKTGIETYNYLTRHFKHLVSESYTGRLEEDLDNIESDSIDPNTLLKDVWQEIVVLKEKAIQKSLDPNTILEKNVTVKA